MAEFTTIEWPAELPVAPRADHWVARAGERELRLSNLDKVYWPAEGYTKGDILTYYFNVSATMLPHLRDRPLTRKRMPDGVGGGFFYEKNAPSHTPKWMPRLPVRSESEGKVIDYIAVDDVLHMLWVVNMGSIEFHPLHAKGPDQAHPTYAFFDLDPASGAGPVATPTLTVTVEPSAAETASAIPCATSPAAARSIPLSTATNSSPPTRATKSPDLIWLVSAPATAFNARSPAS